MKKNSKSFFGKITRLGVNLVLCFLALSMAGSAFAAAYPEKPLELSIVFSPGGAMDVSVRMLAQEVEKKLGQPILTINRPGGGGMPGVAQLAKAPADGYFLAACVSNALIFIPHRNPAPYLPLKDVEPILSFGQAAPFLVVSATNANYATAEDFFAASRKAAANGNELRIGVPGLGSPSHVALAMIEQQDPGLKWRFVPFAGPGEAEAALLGGHVEAAASGDLNKIKSGQTHALMVLAGARTPAWPQAPSLTDFAYKDPGKGDSTFILLAPAGTPEEVLNTLEAAFLEAAQSPAFAEVQAGFSISPAVRGRAETKALLRQAWNEETEILRKVGLIQKPATAPE